MTGAVLAIDAGQSGSKVRFTDQGRAAWEGTLAGVRTDRPLLDQLIRTVHDASEVVGRGPTTVAVGLSGWRGTDPSARELSGALRGEGVTRILLAHDSVTSYLGALGSRTGAVVAAGTGAVTVAVGTTDVARVDGWGHIMGDAGSGLWIGRQALQAAMRAHDGRGPATRILDLVRDRWPDVESAYLQLQADPGHVRTVASLARPVAELAAVDPIAERICRHAAAELAASVVAGLIRVDATGPEASVAAIGGVLGSGLIRDAFDADIHAELPDVQLVPPSGSGLDGVMGLVDLPAEHPLNRLIDATGKRPDRTVVRIANEPRDYAWGVTDGISGLFGWPPSGGPEAELWLGAHESCPSRVVDDGPWTDLADWERQTGCRLPFLLKVLAADSPLSLQAHPTPEQARAGFDLEESRGVPRSAPTRNYKDPYAKPEMIVAVRDGFQALCGFRRVTESITDVAALRGAAPDPAPFEEWLRVLEAGGLRVAVEWLLGPDPAVRSIVGQLSTAAQALPDTSRDLIRLLASKYPGDAGAAVALLLNHVELAAGEALWLPAGNIHAYISGIGVELMGPSDNVLRGGLTPKHVDVPELLRVLDFTGGTPPFLHPLQEQETVRAYRPPRHDAPFLLKEITGDARIDTASPAILTVLSGAFRAGSDECYREVAAGDAVFLPEAGTVAVFGHGQAFLASST